MQVIEIKRSPELTRIEAIPRRVYTPAQIEAIRVAMTRQYRTHAGTMELRAQQALALYELKQTGGLAGFLRVGAGKSLLSFLAPTVLGSVRPVLLLPAALIEKTHRERKSMSTHWQVCRRTGVYSYEQLGRVNQAKLLENVKPDLIILDEAHRAKNKRAGCTRRILRYVHDHPDTRVIVMSGTLLRSSLEDFGHLLAMALKDYSPLPHGADELKLWSEALMPPKKFTEIVQPGALLDSFSGDGTSQRERARTGMRKRILDTPGVVSSGGDKIAASIYIRALQYEMGPEADRAFLDMRRDMIRADGYPLERAVDVWRHARELALGMCYVWDPWPPEPWIQARRAWGKFVRDVLAKSRTLDTEKQVEIACIAGELDDRLLRAWRQVEPTFRANVKSIWQDDSALKICEAWAKKTSGGIIWVEHTHFARELSRRTGLDYFGRHGKTQDGRVIDMDGAPWAGKTCIASIASNATGRNLQAWGHNLITGCPPSAALLEQLIGRTHRDGQDRDEIHVDVLMGCSEHWRAIVTARDKARELRDLTGEEQKILLADLDWPASVPLTGGARWAETLDDDDGAGSAIDDFMEDD